MRINQIVVKNYRHLPDVDLQVRGHLVLIGASDSGKSSVLSALNLLLGVPHAQLLPSVTLRDFSDPDIPLTIEAKLSDFDEDDRATFPDEIRVETNGNENLTLRLEAEISQEDPDIQSVRRFCPNVAGGKQISRSQLDRIGWVLVKADRSLQRELGSSPAGAFKRLLSQTDLGNDQEHISTSIAKLHNLLADSDSLATIRREMANGLNNMLPKRFQPDDLAMVTGADTENSPLADVLLHLIENDGRSSPINEQSDGIRSVALLTLLSLSSTQHGLTAIDEPELHLHPTAQSALGRILALSERQHILATHSGRVAAAFRPTEVTCLSQRRSARRLKHGEEVASDLFVWRWWSSELVETLTSDRIMFVEGASDRIVVEAVAASRGIQLSRLGVQIVELDGAATLRRVIRVLGDEGYGIPTLGLCDLDARDRWAKALGIAASQLSRFGYMVCNPDLEGEVTTALGADRFLTLITKASFIEERSILKACGVSRLGKIGEKDAASYWRRKNNKVRVAAALAAALTEADALKLVSIGNLLEQVSGD